MFIRQVMIRASFSLLLATAAVAAAGEAATVSALQGVAEFSAAYQAWDARQFGTAAEYFSLAISNEPANSTNYYWRGVALFHQMLQLRDAVSPASGKVAADAAMDGAIEAFSDAVKLNAQDAESHALLGTLYGMKINGSLLRAVRFGPRVQKHRERALAAGAENPRVRYLLGMGEFHTASKPAGWRAALASLLTAKKLFELEERRANPPLVPRWGHSSCLTFIGRAYEQLGETSHATEYYRLALARHPADHIAAAGLERTTRK